MSAGFRRIGMLFVIVWGMTSARAAAESPIPKQPTRRELEKAFNKAFAEEAKADFSVEYDNRDKFRIGIGVVKGDVLNSIRFTYEELRHFWELQRHKDFIVVTVDPSMRTDAEDKALVNRLTNYFFRVGFRRVRIHQAQSDGVGVLSDKVNPKNGRP
jgi:hypothetical protein